MPGEINRKLGTGADAASQLDLAADGLDEMLHNRESQAGAAKFAAACFVYPIEPLENTRQVITRDSDPGVGNFDPGGVVAGRYNRRPTDPCSGVYLIALSIKLSTIWRTASSSARTSVSASTLLTWNVSFRFLVSARPRCASTHDSRIGTR